MKKICWHNSDYKNSQIVILGIPDESKSHAEREGTYLAPDKIREISNLRDTYEREGKISKGFPYNFSPKKIHDFGNIKRSKIPNEYKKIIKDEKVPITLGGDHSISLQIIKSLSDELGKISLVYFDAHPDFITSTKNYYGSVFGDCLEYIDKSSSLQIGIRTPENEEYENLKKNNITVVTPFDIERDGISEISRKVLEKIGEKTYISLDMDCIDPAFAPGVSVPVPFGLSSVQVTFLLKSIAKKGIVGMDIVETCPPFDVNDRTSHLASRLIAEVCSSIKL